MWGVGEGRGGGRGGLVGLGEGEGGEGGLEIGDWLCVGRGWSLSLKGSCRWNWR